MGPKLKGKCFHTGVTVASFLFDKLVFKKVPSGLRVPITAIPIKMCAGILARIVRVSRYYFSGSARGGSGIPIFAKKKVSKIPQNFPNIPKFEKEAVYFISKIS